MDQTDKYLHAALTGKIIGAAIEVHEALGPGLLESAYEACLCHELVARGLCVERQVALPVMYRGQQVDCAFRMDIVVEGAVVVEIKSVEAIAPIHEAQLMTYLKLSGLRVGLLMNFNVRILKEGIVRRVV